MCCRGMVGEDLSPAADYELVNNLENYFSFLGIAQIDCEFDVAALPVRNFPSTFAFVFVTLRTVADESITFVDAIGECDNSRVVFVLRTD